MSEQHAVSMPPEDEGFEVKIKRTAEDEAQAVLRDLERAHFRADQVIRVLRALSLPIPEALARFMGADPSAVPQADIDAARARQTTVSERTVSESGAPVISIKSRLNPDAPAIEIPVDVDQRPAPEHPDPEPADDGESPEVAASRMAAEAAAAHADRIRDADPPVDPAPANDPVNDEPRPARVSASAKGGAVKSAREAEQTRERIMAALATEKDMTGAELAQVTGLHDTAVRAHLKVLSDAGRIVAVGSRRSRGDTRTGGRMPTVWAVAQETTDDARALPSAPDEPPSVGREDAYAYVVDHPGTDTVSMAVDLKCPQPQIVELLRELAAADRVVRDQHGRYRSATAPPGADIEQAVRDHVLANQQMVHSAASVSKMLSVSEEDAAQALAKLSLRGMVKPRPTGGYDYVKPTDAGAAARMDRARASTRGADAASAPVAGTGKQQKATHPEVRQIIEACRNQGLKVELAPSGHWAIHCPSKKRVMIANTPSSNRTVLNDRTRLRREGVKV